MEDFKGVQSSVEEDTFIAPPEAGGRVRIELVDGDNYGHDGYVTVDDLVAYLRGPDGYTVEKSSEKSTLYWLRHDSGAHLAEAPEESFMDAPYSAWRRLHRAVSYNDLGAGARRDVNDVSFAEAVRQIAAWAEEDGNIVPPIPADILEIMREA